MGISSKSFATLFKKYRLLSGFSTIGEFADALANEGVIYDESLISKWQRGMRVPSRETLCLVLKIFFKEGGAKSIDEVNLPYILLGYEPPTTTELKLLSLETTILTSNKIIIDEISLLKMRVAEYTSLAKDSSKMTFRLVVEEKVDQLLELLNQSVDLKLYDYVFIIWELVDDYLWDSGRWNDLQLLGEKILVIAKATGRKDVLAKLLIKRLSWLYFWQGNLQKAEKLLNEGINISRCIRDPYLANLAVLRKAKISRGRQEQIIRSLISSMVFFDKEHMQKEIGDALTYLGEIFWRENNIGEAINYFERALKHTEAIKDFDQSSVVFTRLGGVALQNNNLEKAEQYFISSLLKEEQAKRRVGAILWDNIGLGIVASRKKLPNKAKILFAKAKHETKLLGVHDSARETVVFLQKIDTELCQLKFYN